jgi:hypothetical protein
VEVNPGPQVEQAKIDQILAYVKNQKKESKVIKQMFESHKQEMELSEMVTHVIKDYGQIKQALRECEASCWQLENKLRHGDEEKRKNNIIIFGLHEQREESYFKTLDTTVKWLRGTMKVEVTNENIDYVNRLGRRKGACPIVIKFTSFSKKLEVLKNERNSAGSKVRVDKNLSIEDRKARKELVPYLKDDKKWGHKAFLRKDVSIVNGRTYDLSYLKENIQLGDKTRQLDNPVKAQDMTQQEAGNTAIQELDNTQRAGGGSCHGSSLE